jgi:GH24 family phage-related lysozyme (muramidase)
MIMYDDVKSRIKKHEGFVAKVYLDSLGKATIGYGHLLTEEDDFVEGVIYDKDILEAIFDKDFDKAKQGMEELVGTLDIAMAAKGIIIEMVFQLGKTGVSKFKNMFAALNEFDYTRAAEEMLNSAWYRQTPSRCEELSNLMRKCQA